MLLGGLKQLQSTLVAFLLGGLGAAMLLYGWARGNPLQRSHPYRFTMKFTEASKVGQVVSHSSVMPCVPVPGPVVVEGVL